MHTVNIILSSTATTPGKIIRFINGYYYNHASLSFDDDYNHFYTFARKYNNTPFVGGYLEEKPIYLSRGRKKKVDVRIYKIEISSKQYQQFKKDLVEIKNDPEYLYDIVGTVLFPFHLNFPIYKAYNCCEFVMNMLEKEKIVPLTKKPCFYAPQDIDELLKEHLFYEGEIAKIATVELDPDDPFFIRKSLWFHLSRATKNLFILIKRCIKS